MGATKDFNTLFDAVSKNGMKLMHYDYHIEDSDFFIVVDAKKPKRCNYRCDTNLWIYGKS